MISDWLAFWNSSHSICVDRRYKDVHYQLIAQQIAALVPTPQARVLDYGSGEALRQDWDLRERGRWLVHRSGDGKRRSLGSTETGARVAFPIYEPIIEAVWSENIARRRKSNAGGPKRVRLAYASESFWAVGKRADLSSPTGTERRVLALALDEADHCQGPFLFQ